MATWRCPNGAAAPFAATCPAEIRVRRVEGGTRRPPLLLGLPLSARRLRAAGAKQTRSRKSRKTPAQKAAQGTGGRELIRIPRWDKAEPRDRKPLRPTRPGQDRADRLLLKAFSP